MTTLHPGRKIELFFFYSQISHVETLLLLRFSMQISVGGFSLFKQVLMGGVGASFFGEILLLKIVSTTVVGWKVALYTTAVK